MEVLTKKTHLFFWISIPVVLLLALTNSENSIDINVYDTYYVIPTQLILKLLALWFTLTGLAYWWFIQNDHIPKQWMTIVHLICSIDTLILIWLTLTFSWFDSVNAYLINNWNAQDILVISCLLLFLMGQLIFILNLTLTLIRYVKKNGKLDTNQ